MPPLILKLLTTVWLRSSCAILPIGRIVWGDDMYFRRLYELREDNDYTKKFVAEYLTMHPEVYRRYEKGLREIPVWALIKLADLYDVSVDYIVERSDDPARHA